MTKLTLRLAYYKIATVNEGLFAGLFFPEELGFVCQQSWQHTKYFNTLEEKICFLSINPITAVKCEDFKNIRSLQKFNAISVEQFQSLPEFPYLAHLLLRSNAIRYLPHALFQTFPKLTELWIANNELSASPKFGNCMETLEIIEIYKNRIYRIPDISDFKICINFNEKFNYCDNCPGKFLGRG